MSQGWEPIWREHGAQWELLPPEPRVAELAGRLKREGGRRVHDLGCGLGRHLLLFAAEGLETYGSDVSPTAITTCERRLREAGLTATVTRTEMTAIPPPDGYFDAVVAWNVLYHGRTDTILRTIRGARDRLRGGGYLLATFISTNDGQCARTRELLADGRAEEPEPGTFVIPGDTVTDKALPHHYSTEEEIRETLLAGFAVLELDELREDGHTDCEGNPYLSAHWFVLARKEE